MVVAMFELLRSVSPQPPSAFWCADSQAIPRAISEW